MMATKQHDMTKCKLLQVTILEIKEGVLLSPHCLLLTPLSN